MAEAAVGLVLAAPPIIELLFRTWDIILEKKENNKKLENFARDLKSFGVDYSRYQLNLDIERAQVFFRNRGASTGDKTRVRQSFEGIRERLDRINILVDNVLANLGTLHFRKRGEAAKELKDELESTKSSLREFHQLVTSVRDITQSDSPFLLDDQDFLVISSKEERVEINSVTFITEASRAIPDSQPEIQNYIFESKPYLATQSSRSAHKDLRALSQRLSTAQPNSGILPLLGFRESPSEETHQLVFRGVPDALAVHSLQDFYTQKIPKLSLNTRIDLCQQLAEAVLQAHTIGLVHKHIRPDNILLFELPPVADGGCPRLEVYLSGWQYARHIDGEATLKLGEASWQRAIYQHPARQKQKADRAYFITDDIYSLGVCMLEILTWDPLLRVENNRATSMSLAYKKVFGELGLDANLAVSADSALDVLWYTRVPRDVRQVLLKMAEELIPPAAGCKMAELVYDCLDDGAIAPGKDQHEVSQDRKEVAKQFVDTILRDLRSVSSVL